MPILRSVNKDFFNKWSPEMAYVLGFITTDGSVVTNKRGGFFLELTSTDKEMVVKLRALMGSSHTIGVYRRSGNAKTRYRIQIGNKKWINLLSTHGIVQNKSLVIEFPDIPPQYLNHFIRGYFDGDGSVNIGTYKRTDRAGFYTHITTRFTCGSKLFLEGLRNALISTVSGGYLYKKERGFELVFAKRDSLALYRFLYHNAESSSYLNRKYLKLRNFYLLRA